LSSLKSLRSWRSRGRTAPQYCSLRKV